MEAARTAVTAVAAAFIDTQFTTLLTQMALGEDPPSLCAQAVRDSSGLTGGVSEAT